MDKFIVKGGNQLNGVVEVSGSKNSTLPLLTATLLAKTPSILHNVPNIVDIMTMNEVLKNLGCDVSWINDDTLKIDPGNLNNPEAPYDLVRKMRASVLVLGPLIARLKSARVSLPGGCSFGPRPVDLHIKGLRELGCEIEIDGGYIVADTKRLKGTGIDLLGPSGPSRGATSNVMMTAVLAEGKTVIKGSAKEPEIIELADFLNKMGAKISGAGTKKIEIEGVKNLRGIEYKVMDDYIEAGTFLVAGAMVGGDVVVQGSYTENLAPVIDKLQECGTTLMPIDGGIRVEGNPRPKPIEITTQPYPGFPTDMQAQMMAYLCRGKGISTIREEIYPERFNHADELRRMRARIERRTGIAEIEGREKLSGAYVMASDLRASVALVLAGMVAEGETHIRRIYHIDRGYDRIEEKLRSLGAEIERVEED